MRVMPELKTERSIAVESVNAEVQKRAIWRANDGKNARLKRDFTDLSVEKN